MFRNFLKKTPLALLQISREKPKLLIAILGITFADVLMFVQLGVRDALFDSQLLPLNKLQGDLVLVDKRSDNLQSAKIFSRDNLYQTLGIKGVVGVNSLYLGVTTWRNPDNLTSRQIFVYGIEPNHPAMNSPEIDRQLNDLKSLGNVLFDKAGGLSKLGNVPTLLQSQNPLSVQVNDLTIKISGLFTLGSSLGAEGNLIASDSTFLWLFSEAKRQPDEINVGIVDLESKEKLESVKAQLQKILPDNLLVLTMAEFTARERTFWTKDSPVGVIFGFNVAISFLVGTVIVYQILYSDVSKHSPEYATLKAMGYSDFYLVGVILQESLILAILGFMPGFLISAGLYNLAQSATLLPIVMKSSRAISMLALTIFMCIISGAISLRQLQQADPADIF